MKVDTHVHTVFSGRTTIGPLRRLLREPFNSPAAGRLPEVVR